MVLTIETLWMPLDTQDPPTAVKARSLDQPVVGAAFDHQVWSKNVDPLMMKGVDLGF